MKLKMIFLILIMFLTISVNAQVTRDTLVRKKYLDSIKNELASYTVASYQYLNWYDRSQNELRKITQRYAIGQEQFTYLVELKRKQNVNAGIGLAAIMLISFTAVVMFTKNR